ncbi:MAG: iron transporter [Peptococcaceae bacterium BRH_c4a]|nr:MAG: iron transporter [Peptococcaceae bacterium BRH_c4a]
MNCRDFGNKAVVGEDTRYIVVVGNPNVGKTALFNGLSGIYGDVSNFPGTTVDVCYGRIGKNIIIDTPGVYGISSFTGAEELVRDLVLTADVVIDVVDAGHLERDLFLTLHLIDLGLPVLIALNMSDETARYGLDVNREALEGILGVPVIPTVAVERTGVGALAKALPGARSGCRDPVLQGRLSEMAGELGTSEAMALLLLEGDASISAMLDLPPGNDRIYLYNKRRERVNQIVDLVSSDLQSPGNFPDLLGSIMIRPLTGFPVLFLVMTLMYLVVGVFFAQVVVDFTEGTVMEGYYEPFVRNNLAAFMDLDSPLGVILTGQFGLLTMAVTYVLGLLVPLVIGFFLVLSLLEDSGYLPRVAILMDRLLGLIGLNGLAVIPLVLGFGCVTAATITTRLLPTDRERRIAIFLLALAVPCSAQLAFVTAIMSRLGFTYFVLYVFIILVVMVTAGVVMAAALPGFSAPLLLDLPHLRVPRADNVLIKTWLRSWQFIKEAFPLFVGGSLFLSILRVTGTLELIQNSMDPITVGWLNLPRESASAFIMGLIRRDFGTAGILGLPMSTEDQFVAMVSLTLFVPCIASVMIIFKERGWKEGMVIWFSVLALAFMIGGLAARMLGFFTAVGGEAAPLLMMVVPAMLVCVVLAVASIVKRVC